MSNRFFNSDENNSFEKGNAISQAAKNVTKAAAKQAQQQAQASVTDGWNQLLGLTQEQDQQAQQSLQAKQQNQKPQTPPGAQTVGLPTGADAADPANQSKLEEARKKLEALQRMHKENYFQKDLGDEAMKQRAQAEAQQRQQREEEEAQEEEAKIAEKEARDNEFAELTSRPNQKGRSMMKKPKTSIALKQSITKTETGRANKG